VKAVLELASFERFSPTHQAFLDQLTESIGIVLNTIEANMRTENLLKQSQSLAKELGSRQEELQQTNQELQEKAKLLAFQNVEVERKNAEVEQARQALAANACEVGVAGAQRQRNRPVRAARQGNQVLGIVLQPVELDMRGLMNRCFQEGARIEPHQAAIAALTRGEQHDARGRRCVRIARVRILIAEIDGDLAADDGLDAIARHFVGEFQCTEHVVGVGQRQCRLAVCLGEFAELGDLDRALQQRIGGVNVKMDEPGIGHEQR